MANLSELNQFDAVYQLEQTDAIDAGIDGDGIANRQAQQLANRTRFLKNAQDDLVASLSTVATSGSYNDLQDKPNLGSAALANVDDFATAAQGALAASALQSSEKGTADGVASLDATGKVPAAQLPAPAEPMEVFVALNEAEQLALNAAYGDLCKRLDDGRAWVFIGSANASMADWVALNQNLPTFGSAAESNTEDFATAAQGALAASALQFSEKGVANGVASLDDSGKLPPEQNFAVLSAADETAHLALAAHYGDICVRADTGEIWQYIYNPIEIPEPPEPPSLSQWLKLYERPAVVVQSIDVAPDDQVQSGLVQINSSKDFATIFLNMHIQPASGDVQFPITVDVAIPFAAVACVGTATSAIDGHEVLVSGSPTANGVVLTLTSTANTTTIDVCAQVTVRYS